jgi:high-affinity nickel-transport protein
VTVLAVGTAIIIFKLAVPVRLGLAMEFAVAITLILLGLGTAGALVRQIASRLFGTRSPHTEDLLKALPQNLPQDLPEGLIVHSHSHTHDGARHRHPHVHGAHGEFHREHVLARGAVPPLAARRPMLRSFGVGLIHGLAGSAAIALLVLSAIPKPLWATLYLVVFCAGTIIGMGLITTAIATPMIVAARRMSSLHQRLVTGSGLLSFGFGLFLAYQIGIVDRLFDTAPIWIPH